MIPLPIAPPRFWCGHDRADGRRVTWLELFFDLVFVAAVAQVGTQLAHDLSFSGLLRFGFLFLLVWWAWNGYAVYATRFDTNDGFQRAVTLLQMLAVSLMAANADEGLASESSAGFAAAYAVMRFLLVAQYLRAAIIQEARGLARECAIGFGLAAIVWLVSSGVSAPERYAVWALALAIEFGTAIVTARHTGTLPPDAEHLPERFGLFTLILLGEAMIAVMKGMQGQPEWSPFAATAAFLGMGLVFGYWWWYFDGAQAAAHRHVETPGGVRRYQIWNYTHLPLYLGLAVTGIVIEHTVQAGGAEPLHAAEAWMLGGATAVVMTALTILTLVSDRFAARAPSARRVLPGFALAAVPLVFAALAHDLPAAAIVTALAVTCAIQLAFSRATASQAA